MTSNAAKLEAAKQYIKDRAIPLRVSFGIVPPQQISSSSDTDWVRAALLLSKTVEMESQEL